MKRWLTVLLALTLGLVPAAGQAEMTVGEAITAGDITDFYYTYSTSTYPPLYQRYRFYAEDGKKFFFHEGREGGNWPQTEEDVTLSGTVELTEADWAAFYACVSGGRAAPRSEEVLDGDSGPWMYVYWTGDEGIYQEFTFASLEKRGEFEDLCADLAQNHVLTHLFFSRHGDVVPEFYEIFLRKGAYYISENEGEARPLDADLAKDIQRVLEEYDVPSWNGFHGSNPNVLDGEGFTLQFRFADGTAAWASGDNDFPEHYYAVMDGIEEILRSEKMSRIAGAYRCPGAGGDLTLTLSANGDCAFSWGPSRGSRAQGTWSVYADAVYVTGEDGFDLAFSLDPEDGALICRTESADAFPGMKLADGARLVRRDPNREPARPSDPAR